MRDKNCSETWKASPGLPYPFWKVRHDQELVLWTVPNITDQLRTGWAVQHCHYHPQKLRGFVVFWKEKKNMTVWALYKSRLIIYNFELLQLNYLMVDYALTVCLLPLKHRHSKRSQYSLHKCLFICLMSLIMKAQLIFNYTILWMINATQL